MKLGRLKTALIGFGRIGQGYALDPLMQRYFPYGTHAQVLRDHPSFDWQSVVDTNQQALDSARVNWNIKHVASDVKSLSCSEEIEVAVLATGPQERLKQLDNMPNLKAVLVEKPLGSSLDEANQFVDYCKSRKIALQVNLLRRADEYTNQLKNGLLYSRIGKVQAAFGIYGNGILNNGTHMVDLCRLLFGEVLWVQANMQAKAFAYGPIAGDLNFPFQIYTQSGVLVNFQAVDFRHYRENSLDIWGEQGRLGYYHGGLTIVESQSKPNRAMTGEREIAVDKVMQRDSTIGNAMYRMYTNLFEYLLGETELCSTGESALQTQAVIESILQSYQHNGRTYASTKSPS